jgi:hypothetical protein
METLFSLRKPGREHFNFIVLGAQPGFSGGFFMLDRSGQLRDLIPQRVQIFGKLADQPIPLTGRLRFLKRHFHAQAGRSIFVQMDMEL